MPTITIDLTPGADWLVKGCPNCQKTRQQAKWAMARMAEAQADFLNWMYRGLGASGFDPDQARDEKGKWTSEGKGWGPGQRLRRQREHFGPGPGVANPRVPSMVAVPPGMGQPPGRQPVQPMGAMHEMFPHAPETRAPEVPEAAKAALRQIAEDRLNEIETQLAGTAAAGPEAAFLDAERARIQQALGPGGALEIKLVPGGAWMGGGNPDSDPKSGFMGNSLMTPPTLQGKYVRELGDALNANKTYQIHDTVHNTDYAFKPVQGENFDARHTWIYNRSATLAMREVLGGRVDDELGIDLTTPVLYMKNSQYGDGAAMGFVENAVKYPQYGNPSAVGRSDMARLALLDVVIGNLDRHRNNILVTPDNQIHAIDHGYAFGVTKAGDYLRSWPLYQIKAGDMPKAMQTSYADKLAKANWSKVLSGAKLSTKETAALHWRVNQAITRLRAGEFHKLKTDFRTEQ